MDTIASTAFGIDIDSLSQPDDPFVTKIDPILNPNLVKKVGLVLTCKCFISKLKLTCIVLQIQISS